MRYSIDVRIEPNSDEDYEDVHADISEVLVDDQRGHIGSVHKISLRSVDGRGDKDTILEAIGELL